MANLIARSPAAGMAPVRHGPLTLREAGMQAITWLAPFRGHAAAVSADLERGIGVGLPAPNRVSGEGEGAVRAVWAGPGQALILGAEVAPPGAAVADQSDAWAWFVLEGAGASDVLARLTPVDLRAAAFPLGGAARTLLFHMTATLMRTGPDRWEVLVFRSMAQTAAHEIEVAMRRVAAQQSGGS